MTRTTGVAALVGLLLAGCLDNYGVEDPDKRWRCSKNSDCLDGYVCGCDESDERYCVPRSQSINHCIDEPDASTDTSPPDTSTPVCSDDAKECTEDEQDLLTCSSGKWVRLDCLEACNLEGYPHTSGCASSDDSGAYLCFCEEETCAPECDERDCGPDGCGGSCGTCPPGSACGATGRCSCVPECGGKECGDDRCGGSCGNCEAGWYCFYDGTCKCSTSCNDNDCGPDGCGGSCGECSASQSCQSGKCIELLGQCGACTNSSECKGGLICQGIVFFSGTSDEETIRFCTSECTTDSQCGGSMECFPLENKSVCVERSGFCHKTSFGHVATWTMCELGVVKSCDIWCPFLWGEGSQATGCSQGDLPPAGVDSFCTCTN